MTAKQLAAGDRFTGAKTPTSRLARSDQSLLDRGDATTVQVVVKLDYDSMATYAGDVAGFAATSPSRTGHELNGGGDEGRYLGHVVAKEDAFVQELARRVPGAKVGQRLRTVYGGVALTLPANQVADVAKIPGVVAVQSDQMRKPLTDASPSFIGAPALYPSLGGDTNAGKGVIVGVLDTGVWPEHPSFADQGNLGAPPAKANGTRRACDFGDNPTTPAVDPFVCNNKLIGGAAFMDGYLSDPTRAAGEPFHNARDSEGHGTHTSSTAAGDVVASAPVLGTERGPIKGIAPGAWISAYKVGGKLGFLASDVAAGVQQAILDGVKVINFSVSGGTDPFSDPVELAFLDAYAAGVFVAAAAGNEGPAAGTANHVSPWVTTVAASTQAREFDSTLTVTSGGASATFTGASITAGAGPAPIVLASAAPYSSVRCDKPAPAGSFTGKIVACERGGNARVEKGFNVKAGGAVGMIFYNPTLADVETDNHWLPAVHLPDGSRFLAFMAAHPEAVGQFTAGRKETGRGDVMGAFSSRGPGGNIIKPDISAPGMQILAGNTPVPDAVTGGPPGQLFQAIAGTSMSSPIVAGSAVLLKALHPQWTPGQLKSAVMTTANERVVKEDGVTPADPFDNGGGRIDLNVAGNPGLTFDETAARMAALGNDPVNAVHLNLPSVDAPVMPGRLTTVRKATNVTNRTVAYRVKTTAPAGSGITVQPSEFELRPGKTVSLTITIRSSAPAGQLFGKIQLVPATKGLPSLHLPVAFVPRQGEVKLTSECAPATISVFSTATCTVTARNDTFADTTAQLTTTTDRNLPIVAADGATRDDAFTARRSNAVLPGASPGVPSIAPGALMGYTPLSGLGITPTPIGDEDIVNIPVPAFVYGGVTYTSVGVTSNGYLVVGGGSVADVQFDPPGIPNPAPPNNVLAPFWTDLDGTGQPGILAGTVQDGTRAWIVVEWQVHVFGKAENVHFQVWLGTNGTQDVTFAYDPAALPTDPGIPFVVGAENANGAAGQQLPTGDLPTGDLRVTSTPSTPGGSVTYTVSVLGLFAGAGKVTTTMTTPAVPGTTIVTTPLPVRHR